MAFQTPHASICTAQRLFNPVDVIRCGQHGAQVTRKHLRQKKPTKVHIVHKTDYHLKWCNWTLSFSKEQVITFRK